MLLVSGVVFQPSVTRWLLRDAPFGRPSVRGFVVVRPAAPEGVPPAVSVAIEPFYPLPEPPLLAPLLAFLPSPVARTAVPDRAGAWALVGVSLRPFWAYRVVARLPACGSTAAVVVRARPFRVARAGDLVLRRCP